jgi:hypothetical protein
MKPPGLSKVVSFFGWPDLRLGMLIDPKITYAYAVYNTHLPLVFSKGSNCSTGRT